MTITLKSIKCLISVVLLGAVLTSCVQSDYTKLVKQELGKGVRRDSLLLGIYFGNTRNEFYGKCFDLNKAGLVMQGPGNKSVQHVFIDSSVHKKAAQIRLLFMPVYDSSQSIAQMNMEFSYTAWAPWNKEAQSDSLKIKAMKLLMNWYKGNEFINAKIGKENVPVKLDGNRRIILYIENPQTVTVKIQDILNPLFAHKL